MQIKADIHWKDKAAVPRLASARREPDDQIKEMLGINKPNPQDAAHIMRHHFSNVTSQTFIENLKKYCPRFFIDMKP